LISTFLVRDRGLSRPREKGDASEESGTADEEEGGGIVEAEVIDVGDSTNGEDQYRMEKRVSEKKAPREQTVLRS